MLTKLYLIGNNGNLSGSIGKYSEVMQRFSPIFEIIPVRVISQPDPFYFEGEDKDFNHLREYVQSIYSSWTRYGPYGDVIQVSQIAINGGFVYTLDFIANLAYHKPSLAADLVPFIVDDSDNIFFLGIIRDKPPKAGELALLGGHMDINEYHLETAAESLIHEGREEVGMQIIPIDDHTLRNKPFASKIAVKVVLGKEKHHIEVDSYLRLLGTFATSDEEKMPNLNLKRVYQTTGYILVINVKQVLNHEILTSWFKAGSDARELAVVDMLNNKFPKFGIEHHQKVFNTAWYKLTGKLY